MKSYTYTAHGYTFDRVNKATARRAYNNGLTVILCPCNLRPGGPWHPEISINKAPSEKPFDQKITEFEYYNCPTTQTGKYPAFYIPVRYVDRFSGEPTASGTRTAIKEYDYSYLKED